MYLTQILFSLNINTMLDKVFMKIAEYYLRLFTLNSSGLFTDLSLILKKAEEKQFSMSRKVLIVRDFLLKHAFIEKNLMLWNTFTTGIFILSFDLFERDFQDFTMKRSMTLCTIFY